MIRRRRATTAMPHTTMAEYQSKQSQRRAADDVKALAGRSAPSARPLLEIKALAQQHGPQAIARLAQLSGLISGRPGADSEAAQIAAIKELLDRGYGKSTQPLAGDRSAGPMHVTFTWADATPPPEPGAGRRRPRGRGGRFRCSLRRRDLLSRATAATILRLCTLLPKCASLVLRRGNWRAHAASPSLRRNRTRNLAVAERVTC